MKKGDPILCIFPHCPCELHTELQDYGYIFPVFNNFYTIREITQDGDGIFLKEIINPVYPPSGRELAFHLDYFKTIIIKSIIKKSYICTP